ncbi:hypothetical protein CEXT_684421 [Caerostris extrusa]|uniref:Uncharacterized protein n=1 Tax=Caerostris extrusa TaxID=172846 RepID=A0AAV4XNM8_CAEEX|nr:hypothetical protein CEXT_684421 [Caerostris extrusa]
METSLKLDDPESECRNANVTTGIPNRSPSIKLHQIFDPRSTPTEFGGIQNRRAPNNILEIKEFFFNNDREILATICQEKPFGARDISACRYASHLISYFGKADHIRSER